MAVRRASDDGVARGTEGADSGSCEQPPSTRDFAEMLAAATAADGVDPMGAASNAAAAAASPERKKSILAAASSDIGGEKGKKKKGVIFAEQPELGWRTQESASAIAQTTC